MGDLLGSPRVEPLPFLHCHGTAVVDDISVHFRCENFTGRRPTGLSFRDGALAPHRGRERTAPPVRPGPKERRADPRPGLPDRSAGLSLASRRAVTVQQKGCAAQMHDVPSRGPTRGAEQAGPIPKSLPGLKGPARRSYTGKPSSASGSSRRNSHESKYS